MAEFFNVGDKVYVKDISFTRAFRKDYIKKTGTVYCTEIIHDGRQRIHIRFDSLPNELFYNDGMLYRLPSCKLRQNRFIRSNK